MEEGITFEILEGKIRHRTKSHHSIRSD